MDRVDPGLIRQPGIAWILCRDWLSWIQVIGYRSGSSRSVPPARSRRATGGRTALWSASTDIDLEARQSSMAHSHPLSILRCELRQATRCALHFAQAVSDSSVILIEPRQP
jgi:hypothetical protein